MLEGLIGNINTSGFLKGLMIVFWWSLALTIFSLLMFWIWRELQYSKVRFVVRRIADNRTVIYEDKARIIKRKGQPIRWKLKKLKDFVPVPPDKAIEITRKGRYFVEAYYTEHGEYVYIEDKFGSVEQLGCLHPVKSSDKEFYVQQQEQAKKYEGKNWQDILLQLAPVMAILMILIIFMIFFDRTVAPSMELGSHLSLATDKIVEALNLVEGCQQIIEVIPN